MNFPNPMLREVRLFYEKEFALGEYALGMIKQRLNISLPLDDAASIALHIVSAEFDTRVKDTLKITEIFRRCYGTDKELLPFGDRYPVIEL